MKENLFDNIVKELDEYQSPIDLDMEWGRYLEGQQEDKKKKRNLWMFCFFLAFLCPTMIYLIVSDSNPTNIAKGSKSSLNSTAITYQNTKSNIIDVDVDVAKEQDVLSRNRSIVNEVKKISRKEMVHSSYAEFSSDRENSSEPNDPIEENRSLFSKNLPEKSIPLNGNNKTVRDTEQKEYLPTLISLESLTPLAIPTPSIEDIAEPNFRLSKPKRKIEIYFNTGLAITNQIFKAKDASSNDYSSLRDFSENSLETYTYDIGVNIPVGKKSFVKIGGNYNVNYDKINYTYDAPKTFDFENVLIKIRKNPNNEVVEEIFGDTTVIGSETITNTLYNRYSSTNLEVSFGHYLFAKNRLSLAITGGLFYNISLKTKGKVISPENEQAGLVALDGYKKSFGLGLIGGADIDFKINESWMLNLRPTVSYGLFSATNQSNMLNANIHKYGISLGVKYKL